MGMPATTADLRKKAMRYRHLMASITDQRTIDALMTLAAEYEAMAERMEHRQRGDSTAQPP